EPRASERSCVASLRRKCEIPKPVTMNNPTNELAQLKSRTMWRAVLDAAARFPSRDAYVGADDAGVIRRMTYEGLVTRVRNLSAGLASIGVCRGDRVVLWMTNRLEWIVASFSIMRLGAAVVPI